MLDRWRSGNPREISWTIGLLHCYQLLPTHTIRTTNVFRGFCVVIAQFELLKHKFCALLEEFFWDALLDYSGIHYPLDDLHSFKTGSLNYPLKLGEKKKVTRSKIRWVGRLFQDSNVPLSQEMQNVQHSQSRYSSDMTKSSLIITHNTFLFHNHLTCYHLSSQMTVATHHLSYPLDVDLSPACWMPLAPLKTGVYDITSAYEFYPTGPNISCKFVPLLITKRPEKEEL